MTNSFHKMLTRVRQMRFLTLSFLIHLGLIALLGGVVLFKGIQKTEVFVANSGTIVENTEEFNEQTDENSAPAEPEKPTESSAPSSDQASAIATLSASSFTLSTPSTPLLAQTAGQSLGAPATASLSARPTAGGGGKSLGALSSRSAGERSLRLQMTGGKQESELAVMNGLRWLKKVQSPDGTWGAKYKTAMTGFALLCFLGHGEIPGESIEFGVTVKKAIIALLKMANDHNGQMSKNCYEQGIATYALAEAYAMTKDEETSATVIKASSYILKGQADDGGWNYNFSRAMPSDTSVSGWMIQALKTIKLAEIHIDEVPLALENALKNIERVYDPNKAVFCYRKPGDHGASLNGVGILSKFFIAGREDKMIRDALKTILEGPEVDYEAKQANLYSWYYNTQACFQAQGSAWNRWNRMFQNQLIKHQSQDGSWPPTGGNEPGKMNEIGPDGDVLSHRALHLNVGSLLSLLAGEQACSTELGGRSVPLGVGSATTQGPLIK